jgi:cation-transporting P-type ATPase J
MCSGNVKEIRFLLSPQGCLMSPVATTDRPLTTPQTERAVLRPRRTRLLALPEVRWATASLVAFALALALQLTGTPAWAWGPMYTICYLTGGWEPALAGLKALRDKTLDVDLLMIVAAIGAAALGQVMDGGLLIVIFATSGALEALATARTADLVRGHEGSTVIVGLNGLRLLRNTAWKRAENQAGQRP